MVIKGSTAEASSSAKNPYTREFWRELGSKGKSKDAILDQPATRIWLLTERQQRKLHRA